ncbi:DUF1570 domain-containing protein [uncultured Algimonas sp.]|uniref:DUF1570 domain-containing protein n=1 Tax=uncultured Algimonas sp. TaxID=1547920 RepID=UPI00260817E0|nr:DUF1570 domain-containing protein [uncultured Algimonas sp.]
MLRLLFPIAILSSMLAAMFAGPAAAQGVSARSDHFVLMSDAPVDARSLLTDLEDFRLAVMADLGLDPGPDPVPLRLNIIDDTQVFDAVTPGGITAAIYRQSAAGHDIVVGYDPTPGHFLSRALEPGWLRLVLRHEVVHHILETRYARKLPIWLGEGLAEYYSTYERGADGRVTFGRALPEQDPLSETQHWLPMRTVIENLASYPDFRLVSGPDDPPFRAQRLYYGQSWALAHFVMDQPDGLASIHRFVDEWSPANDSEASFEAAFGLGYDPLEARIRRDIVRDGGHLRLAPAVRRAGAAVSVSPAARLDRLENHLRLLLAHGRTSAATQAKIDAVRDRLGPTESTAALDLARSQRSWRLQDWDGADAAVTRVLARNPGDATALKLRTKIAYGRVAGRQSEQELWDAAESAAIRALEARPDDPELHLFRVAVSLPTTERLSPGARASLDWLQARDIHLRLPHLSLMMIPALIYEDRFDHADAVLDSAARWTERAEDQWVIDRLRRNVGSERPASE